MQILKSKIADFIHNRKLLNQILPEYLMRVALIKYNFPQRAENAFGSFIHQEAQKMSGEPSIQVSFRKIRAENTDSRLIAFCIKNKHPSVVNTLFGFNYHNTVCPPRAINGSTSIFQHIDTFNLNGWKRV